MESQDKVDVHFEIKDVTKVKESRSVISKFSYKTLDQCKVTEENKEVRKKMNNRNRDTEPEDRPAFSKDGKLRSGKLAWTTKSGSGETEASTSTNEPTEATNNSESTKSVKPDKNPGVQAKPIFISKDGSNNKTDIKNRFASSKTGLNITSSSPNKPKTFRKEEGRIAPISRSVHRPNSWHGAFPEKEKKVPVRIHRTNRGVPCVPPVLNDQSKYSYNTSEFGCPFKPPKKPIVTWVSCNEGRVQPGAIVAGKEYNNPYTFIGRVTLRNERYTFFLQ